MQTLIEALILLLLLYLAFFKSYFLEKGKNLATQEDIEKITLLVKSVESQLEFTLQAKLSLRAEEHQALVDYFSKYSAWLSAITNWSAVGINTENTSRLAETRSQLGVLHRDFDLAAGKVMLFVQNQEIQDLHDQLHIETLKLQAHAELATFDIETILLEAKQLLLTTASDKLIKQYGDLLEKESELYKKHKDEQLEMYKALMPLAKSQQRAISQHIRALVKA